MGKMGTVPEGGLSPFFYHFDGLGSVTSLTDPLGQILESYTYNSYGKPLIKDASGTTLQTSSIGNRFMFTAREYDSETGLYYYRARYYDPGIGRFLQRDPLGIDDENTYAYCYNDPVNLIDPYGYQGISGDINRLEIWRTAYDWGLSGSWIPNLNILPPLGDVLPMPPIPGQNAPLNPKLKEKSLTQQSISENVTYAATKGIKEKKDKDKDSRDPDKDNWWERLKEWWRDWRFRFEKHDKPHKFNFFGKRKHFQFTIWRKGIKGSHRNFRIPLP